VSERVVVAMSGGVDSSVAAALLVEQGHEVIGITMHLSGSASRCCSLDDADDARRVAERLGIKFYVANYAELFRREVIEPFADSYLNGETPIPCVACNQRLKFRHLLDRAEALGATSVATGHYAQIDSSRDGRHRLRRGADPDKDQSYFLFDLDQERLGRIRFPVGAMKKDEVRARARELGLATADKAESQEICFVPDDNYAAVIESIRPDALPGKGEIVDESGTVVGEHGGIHRFTVGQRRGVGVAQGERRYVKSIDAARNRIEIAAKAAIQKKEARVRDASWIAGTPPAAETRCRVQVRYRHEGAWARFEELEGRGAALRVRFESLVTAVTPGQAAVFYDGDEVLGGGWIEADSP
jgi:tRNA-specific 2-thiouridylase